MFNFSFDSDGNYYDENGILVDMDSLLKACKNVKKGITEKIYSLKNGEVTVREIKVDRYFIDETFSICRPSQE